MSATTESAAPATPAPRPCGLLRRLLAMLYDTVVVVALLMLAAALALPFGDGHQSAGRDAPYTAYLVAVWWLYVAGCWHRGGMTLGMRAWRVRITTVDGSLPGWGRCAIRFAASLLSAAAAGLGFLLAPADAQRRTWHDRASGTRLWYQPR